MDNKLGIIGKVLMYILMVAGVLITIVIMRNGDTLKEWDLSIEKQQAIMDYAIYIIFISLGITALLTLSFPLVNMLKNPKALLSFLGVIAVLGLIYLVSYSLADSTIEPYMLDPDYETSEQGAKIVGSILYLTYIIGGLTVLATIGSSIMNLFKR